MDEDKESKIEVRHEPTLIEAHEPAMAEAPVTPPEAPQPTPAFQQHVNTPGVIVLQWLSYAFWGWLILALTWLVGIIATNAITGAAVEEVVPYAMAATIVLLPIAFVTDLFYRKHEPFKKTGATTVIMVIHVVLYALLGIGTLIAMVFTAISMVIGSSNSYEGQTIALWVLGAATLFYAATFLRVLNPFKTKRIAMIFGFGMLAVTIGLLIWGIAGPVVTSLSLKNDRLIEHNLVGVSDAVNDYITSNKKLPGSLSDVTLTSTEEKQLVSDGLVRYKKVGTVTPTTPSYSVRSNFKTQELEYRYQLCVTYTHAYKSSDSYTQQYRNPNEYQSYLSIYGHPAGDVCYKLMQLDYDGTSSSGVEF